MTMGLEEPQGLGGGMENSTPRPFGEPRHPELDLLLIADVGLLSILSLWAWALILALCRALLIDRLA